MTTQQTPGPWKVGPHSGTGEPDSMKQYKGKPFIEHTSVTAGETGSIKQVAHIYQGLSGPLGSPEACGEQLANARLIAAAPELAAACDECDTAFAVINIGSDEGLTPQATQAMAQAWLGVCEAMYKATRGNHWLACGDLLRTKLAARIDQQRAEGVHDVRFAI